MKSKGYSVWHSIGFKLFIGFLLPILCIIFLGFVSYQKASEAIINNYEQSIENTLIKTGDYLNLGLQSVVSSASQLSDNELLYDIEEYSNYGRIYQEMIVRVTSNEFISAIHVFHNSGAGVSTLGNINNDFYQGFLNSHEVNTFLSNTVKSVWIEQHPYIDEKLNAFSSRYCLSLLQRIYGKGGEIVGYITADVKRETVQKVLESLELHPDSQLIFITQNGQKMTVQEQHILEISDLNLEEENFYQQAKTGILTHSSQYITIQGIEYLFTYTKVSNSTSMLCALIPKSAILEQVKSIRITSIILVLAACITAAFIGAVLTIGIGKTVRSILKNISKAAKGDLTVTLVAKRKDEFGRLAEELFKMIEHFRILIKETQNVGKTVSNSAKELTDSSSTMLKSTQDIRNATDEINAGIDQQSQDTQLCLMKTEQLSEQIHLVFENTRQIEIIAQDTQESISEGFTQMEKLTEKTDAASDITESIVADIQQLSQHIKLITGIIDLLDEIAEQTGLLSLNASIEAARAGEQGKGFAVVADEVKKLADRSSQSVGEVRKVIEKILLFTEHTVKAVEQAEEVVTAEKETAVNMTVIFEVIGKKVTELTGNLNIIAEEINSMEISKNKTLEAIESISAISQETATSSENVSTSAKTQVEEAARLYNSADELRKKANELETAIQIFQVE